MSPRYFLLLLTLLFLGLPLLASAQQANGPAEDAAVTYLERNWNRHGLASQADVAELVITDAIKSRRGNATSVYLHQGIDGIPVIDGQMTISVDANGHVFHAAGQLVPDVSSRAVHSGSGVGPAAAANTIAAEAGFPAPVPFQVTEPGVGPTSKTTLDDAGGFTYLPVTAELVYIVDDNENLRLAWDATVPLHGGDGAWRGLVDASNSEVLRLQDVLDRDNFGTVPPRPLIRKEEGTAAGMLPRPTVAENTVGGACYNVFAWPVMDPFLADPAWPADGRELICDPADPTASPGGWHDLDGDNVPDTTITRGNNVWAFPDWENCEDWPSPPECDPVPATADGGPTLQFDFPLDFTLEPHDYMEASVTNLFYWNNLIHDVMVHYGFDEAHGNFQQHNYTTDGAGGDFVRANGQDGGGANNANFLTPADGQQPRMQMYLGVNHTPGMDGSLDNHVVLHEYGHGISNRMTGGPSSVNCLQNAEQMGEGWSDWYGLMLTQDGTRDRNTERGAGLFLFHDNPPQPWGIRPAPYTTDFGANDYTYQRTRTQAVPHGVGFVWATILWEVTWDVVDVYGYDQDIYNAAGLAGNQIMMSLVTEGLNLQPCSPGFVDGRDAIIEAVDVVYGDQDEQWRSDLKQALWGGFARRGLGHFADQGSSGSNDDNVENFTISSERAPDAITDLVADPDGDFVTLTWTTPDDMDSDVFGYEVRRSSEPILNETDWDAATPVPTAGMAPQAPGTAEEFVVMGLDFETTYHFSVRSDDAINTSDLSNSAEATTLAPPVADVPIDPIEITVPAEGSATHAFTISNAGPSTLRYILGFRGTTEEAVGGGKAIARPAPREANIPERDGEGAREDPGDPQLLDEGGPDAFGYRWIDSNEPGGPAYDWVDITATGTEVPLDVDDYQIVDLPWDFPYYENTYDWVAIQSKGVLAFEDAFVGYVNQPIPTADAPNTFIAGYWDDLDPSSGSGGGAVYYGTDEWGRFVVSWVGVPHWSSGGSFSFQIILDPYGTIIVQYQEVNPAPQDMISATVGIENPDGTDGLQVVHNASYVENELAIRFTPLWVEADVPAISQIAAGAEETVTLSFDASGLDPGTYTADMTVTTNESGTGLTQEYTIPITLTVEGVGTEDEGVAFEGTHRLSAVAPNPISSLAQATLEVAEAQDVRFELFDVRGRKVATPFEGSLAARNTQEITLDAGTLAPGVYVLKISGETFSETQRLTIVR